MNKHAILLNATRELEEKTREMIIFYEEVASARSDRTYLRLTIKDEPICTIEESFETFATIFYNNGYSATQIADRAGQVSKNLCIDEAWVELRAEGTIDSEPFEIYFGSLKIVAVAPIDEKTGFIIAKRY